MTYSFTQNDVLSYFYQGVTTLFAAGSYTASVYTDIKQRTNVPYSSTHGSVVMYCDTEISMGGDICSVGVWADSKILTMRVYIAATSRNTAYQIYSILEDYLKAGKFQTIMTLPVAPVVPSELMYTELRGVRTIPSDSELYGLQAEFDVYFYRV